MGFGPWSISTDGEDRVLVQVSGCGRGRSLAILLSQMCGAWTGVDEEDRVLVQVSGGCEGGVEEERRELVFGAEDDEDLPVDRERRGVSPASASC